MSKQVVSSAYVPRPHSLAFHARKERFAVMVLHRRAGKTVMCINDLIDKAIQCKLQFPQYSYICPFYSQAKSVAWNYLKHYAAPITEKVMESELSVVLKNGAKIRLFGADNPDALRGLYHDGVVIDEYAQIQPRLFGEVIAPALSDRKGWAVFIGTPFGQNAFYDVWNEAQTNDSWYTMMLKASESGIIDAEELRLMRDMPGSDENTYQQEFECSFTAAVRGAFYADHIAKIESTNTGSFPYDPNKEVITAWDIGYTDSTCVWFAQTNGKELAIIDFLTVNSRSVAEVLDLLSAKPYSYGTFYLPHDAANKSFQTGKSTRELMIAAGCTTRLVPSLSVQDGIQAVRATLPTCFFNTDNADVRLGLNAMKLYRREFDDKARIFKDKPLHDWTSDIADAFRMLALAMNPAAAKKSAKMLNSPLKQNPNNVMNLHNLFADRANRKRSARI